MNEIEKYLQPDDEKQEDQSLVNVSASRSMMEVQAQVIMAKKFPRDQFQAYQRIIKACERPLIAENAQYLYPKGGKTVEGPSIRLAEVLAQCWGNLEFGVRELSQKKGESVAESYCWDLETNVRQSKTFTVSHSMKLRTGKIKNLDDPRDVYEHVANYGARRLRACILGIIPGDIVDAAVKKCNETATKKMGESFEDGLRKLVAALDQVGVKTTDIEERLGHKIDATTIDEAVELKKIFISIKDGISKRGDWFKAYKKQEGQTATDLNDKFSQPQEGAGESLTQVANELKPENKQYGEKNQENEQNVSSAPQEGKDHGQKDHNMVSTNNDPKSSSTTINPVKAEEKQKVTTTIKPAAKKEPKPTAKNASFKL